ncbi:hypothetical protein E2562_010072 [Oryza meyeriana var. granulata]|uniref:Response regulatory domain-containing protein n=1 Tax=Oryza meyeriana var. granulata TaxID=110450 RepID=A0A6G1EI33_9ORYZ|nr:hypothetical protein E2562_010072 [Oryza meyeriana var. granulata]
MGGGVEERKVVDLEDGDGEEGEDAAAAGSSRETRMLPKMPVRVLLAEGDDSTRHIICALLRKCGYRVAAASDGVKAWDILKEKSFNIDLVLTEVELPLMSGFLLLSTIMEHDACKNIPVIMMSSNDSISMVFKCMLKGAADFLVKPIRKNELRNLWQHVWRKQLSNGGLDVQHTQQEDNLSERHEQKTGVAKAEHAIENVVHKNMECSEQESDAQSSCTRSELEADSRHTNNLLEYKHPMGRHFSKPDHKNTEKNGGTKRQAINDGNLVLRREEDASPRRMAYEPRHVSPTTGESGSSTVLDSARKTLSGSVCDSSSNHMNAPTESANIVKVVPENPSTEGLRHLSQREAALNKFRLKRKDRCGTRAGSYSQSSDRGLRANLFGKIIVSKEARVVHTAGDCCATVR